MNPGIKGSKSVIVTKENTAAALGSGSLEVFATPALLALMEGAAAESVSPYLKEGETTVGSGADLKHTAATPLGMTVTCESVLTECEGRRLVFKITASDQAGPVGECTHERYIVGAERFMQKAEAKKSV